jgi:CDP-diacylglycerol--serine O-phosphatidyltransferase
VFYYPNVITTAPYTYLAMAMMLVPALLMVSTIRFRSFKAFDLGARRGYQVLIIIAGALALFVTYPHEVLLTMAYSYLASAFIGLAWSKFRKRDEEIAPSAVPSA